MILPVQDLTRYWFFSEEINEQKCYCLLPYSTYDALNEKWGDKPDLIIDGKKYMFNSEDDYYYIQKTFIELSEDLIDEKGGK